MFSRQLICATFILSELSSVRHKYGAQAGLERIELNGLGKASNVSMNRALQKLKKSCYINYSISTRRYTLSIDIKEISMFDLVKLFHGNPVIGEEYDPVLIYGDNYLPLKECGYEAFIDRSEKLRFVIEEELLKMKISHFINYTLNNKN